MTFRTPAVRIHASLGGLMVTYGGLVSAAGMATSCDPFGTSADRAMADIAAAREHLNELELALLVVKADGEAKLKGVA